MTTRTYCAWAAVIAAVHLTAVPAYAQQARDTLTLGVLQSEAVRRDPRANQIDLLSDQSALRLRSIDAERLPAITVLGQGQYQSDVATIPVELPGGMSPPSPPNDTYDAHLAARQRVYDPALVARRRVEDAVLAESQARVRSTLHGVRTSVNEAYFTALLLQSQADELTAVTTRLEAQLRVAVQRVEEGAALPSEAAMLEAELLRRRQSLDEVTAGGAAARLVLADLTGRSSALNDVLSLPDLGADVARTRARLEELRARPEFEQFARSRDVLAVQADAVAARTRPRISAYGRAGYGRPGLDPLASEFDTYWLAGVQVEWTPWTWGTAAREREVLAIQQQIIATEEAAFARSIQRAVMTELAAIDRLERTVEGDSEIIELREEILRETRVRYAEGVITSAEYVDRETAVLDARLARVTHRVELARARARFLTLVGIEIR